MPEAVVTAAVAAATALLGKTNVMEGVIGHYHLLASFPNTHRLVGLVVGRPPPERKVPGSNPACAGIFSGPSHTSDFKNWHSSGYPARRLAL